MSLKEQLKSKLRAKRYNFAHLAQVAETDAGTVSRILGGYRKPSARLARDLARAARELTGSPYLSHHFLHNTPLED